MTKIGEMEVRVNKDVLLERLRKNRDNHAQIVKEARAGYVAKAQETLKKRLDELVSGKLVSLRFSLEVPIDQTKEYDTVIGMLTMSTEDTLVLSATEYRCLVEDNWGWKQSFMLSNAPYSVTAALHTQGE